MTIVALISDKVRIGCSSARHLFCCPAVFSEGRLTRILDFLSKYGIKRRRQNDTITKS